MLLSSSLLLFNFVLAVMGERCLVVVLQNRDGGLLPEMDEGGDDCTTVVGKPLLGKAGVRRNRGTN